MERTRTLSSVEAKVGHCFELTICQTRRLTTVIDSRVYIWRQQTGLIVAALDAHYPGTVNCVSWHPKDPTIWASAGDDKKVKIWSNQRMIGKRSGLSVSSDVRRSSIAAGSRR